MKPNTFSPGRRQVILAGFASFAAPAAALCAAPLGGDPHLAAPLGGDPRPDTIQAPGKLVLSGRIVHPDGKPLAGATVEVLHAARDGGGSVATDGDGRFVIVTTTPAGRPELLLPERLRYRVSYNGYAAEGQLSKRQRDADGTWRTSFGLTLA